MSAVVPVVLSGGVGSRLWPLSRQQSPKQLLSLAGPATMIQDTLARTDGEGFSQPIVICGEQHRFLVAEQLLASGVAGARIILEPKGRNTAPAAAIAALAVIEKDPDGLALLMPSDHVVTDRIAFHAAVAKATQAAESGALVTFGIIPSAPETGYGYIKGGAALERVHGAFLVDRFVEKPDRPAAEGFLASGDYYWNSGMFLFSAVTFLEELERLEPKILDHCRRALSSAERDTDFIRLEAESFVNCPSQSIDYAVMEHAKNVVVVPVEMGWNDVGSWLSLWEIAARNREDNAVLGDVVLHDTHRSYARSEGPLIAAVGVKDLVIVATPDAVLVSHKNSTQDVKKIVDMLEQQRRYHHISHPARK